MWYRSFRRYHWLNKIHIILQGIKHGNKIKNQHHSIAWFICPCCNNSGMYNICNLGNS